MAAPDKQQSKTKSGKFDPEKFFRICQRLQRFFSAPPAALAPVLTFPEVFVAIAVSIIYIIYFGMAELWS